ncbi:MAG: 6-phosphofructokinase, partial [Proteobacteria bacterium]|nr:6-phosphofructokinase [Pseudomonadota bacterium]
MKSIDLIDEIGLDKQIETTVPMLGECKLDSPLLGTEGIQFVSDEDRVLVRTSFKSLRSCSKAQTAPPSFELAGPRERIFFHPNMLRCAIVTRGGLCPGTNAVIGTIVTSFHYTYGVRCILGIRSGLQGFIPAYGLSPIELTQAIAEEASAKGGTILGTSRGLQDTDLIVDSLVRMGVGVLFLIGGAGTLRLAMKIADKVETR